MKNSSLNESLLNSKTSPSPSSSSSSTTTSFNPSTPSSIFISSPSKTTTINSSSSSSSQESLLDLISNYDYCMVFLMKDGNLSEISHIYLNHLTLVGINWILISSLDKKYVYTLLKAKLYVLKQLAIDLDYQMLLDPEILQKQLEKGDIEAGISPLKIQHQPQESSLFPYHHIYAPYRSEVDQNLYWKPNKSTHHPFRDIVRMKLTELLIETKLLVPLPSNNQNSINISDSEGTVSVRRAIINQHIVAFFPLHNPKKINQLSNNWLKLALLPWEYPINDIKEYFGEKIALYFEFMGHYTKWMVIPAIIGLPIQILCWIENNYNTPGQVIFSCILVLWAVFMLEYWKRKEKNIALQRGMLDYEDTEVDRPEFEGILQPSYIDGKMKVYFPRHEKHRRFIVVSAIIFGCIAIVIGAVGSIYIIKATLTKEIGSLAQIISSILNAIQIQIFKYLYVSLADNLTEWENPRTDTEFEDAMIPKLYLFEFVNSYASFFYVAFIAPSLDECASETCMAELGINLFIIFAIRVSSGIISEGLYPFYQLEIKKRRLHPFLKLTELNFIPPIDLQFDLESYDIVKDSLGEYSEIAIQYGYIALFASALPIAPLIGLICSIIETKIDSYKFIYLYKRPTIQGAQDIGNWQSIFTITTIVAVVTNAVIIVFTMNYLDKQTSSFKFWFFCIFQWVMFGLLGIVMEAVPDTPSEILIQLQRQRIIVDKLIFRISDIDLSTKSAETDDTTTSLVMLKNEERDYHIYNSDTIIKQLSLKNNMNKSSKNLIKNKSLFKKSSKEIKKMLSIEEDNHVNNDNNNDNNNLDDSSKQKNTSTSNLHNSSTIYSLPRNYSKKGKYLYSRSGSNVGSNHSSRILDGRTSDDDDEDDDEDEKDEECR